MAMYHLHANIVHYILDRKMIRLSLDLRVKDHLKQNVSQLLPKQGGILPVDRFHCFVDLLDKAVSNALMGLLAIPRASLLRAQKRHDRDQILKIVSAL